MANYFSEKRYLVAFCFKNGIRMAQDFTFLVITICHSCAASLITEIELCARSCPDQTFPDRKSLRSDSTALDSLCASQSACKSVFYQTQMHLNASVHLKRPEFLIRNKECPNLQLIKIL